MPAIGQMNGDPAEPSADCPLERQDSSAVVGAAARARPGLPGGLKVEILTSSVGRKKSLSMGARTHTFFKALSALALGLSVAGCVTAQPPYPNVAPIDTTGNYGAR